MSKLWRVIGDNATEQVLLETSAENVTVADTGEKLEATTVEGALGELADGVNELRKTNIIDIEQGIPTTENGNTITPINFMFSNGTSKTVNIYAKQGEKGDTVAKGAKITGELPTTGWTMGPEWAESNLPAKRKWNSVAYGNGVFVALAYNGYYGAYSTDGINWRQIDFEILRDRDCVTYGGDKFVALSSNTQYGEYSTDGINWTTMTMPKSRVWIDITYGNGKFVAISDNPGGYGAYSTDGINWTEMRIFKNNDWFSVTYGGDKFVAVGRGTQYGAYSTDGINWTQMSLDAIRTWNGITYGNGKFVAIAKNSEYGAYSTDGINWTTMTMPAKKVWNDITYGNGMFVAIAENTNIVAYSRDGINWFTKTLMSTDIWYGVTYGRGKFITIAFDSAHSEYWDVSKLSYNYSIWDSVIKANSTVSMYLNSADEVQAYSKTDGSVVVEMDAVPTVAIPYTLQVVETSTEGAFEIVNSYVPVIPTDNSELTNGAGYITNTPEHLYLTDTSTGKIYEVTIANGTISLVAQSST